MRIHLDTDFAGDIDDACALGLLLGWPDVEITGITTVADPDSRRAAYVERFLGIAGRTEIPVAAGAGASLAGNDMGGLPDHDAFWGGEPLAPFRGHATEATTLIADSVDAGATIVGIGPYTNLAIAETTHPGALDAVPVVLMGGAIDMPRPGLPQWGPDMDWNVQCDTAATMAVCDGARDLTLVTLTATLDAHLQQAHLPRLEAAGPLGALLARQARAHNAHHNFTTLGQSHAALPDDLMNFQYDPVACATALGWAGVTTDKLHLRAILDEVSVLRFARDATGKQTKVVTHVDGDAFAARWLEGIAAT
jgi:inosine-uridine nucleoside N-ribohydrolase